MRAVVKPGPGPGLEMVDHPTPEPSPGEILIRVKAASICGTDLHIRNWDPWAADHVVTPLVTGHEACGIVEASTPSPSVASRTDPTTSSLGRSLRRGPAPGNPRIAAVGGSMGIIS